MGAVTDRDSALRICTEDRSAGRTHVSEIMRREVLTCRATGELERAEALMAARHKTRIILVEPNGRLAGVMSLADIAEHRMTRALCE